MANRKVNKTILYFFRNEFQWDLFSLPKKSFFFYTLSFIFVASSSAEKMEKKIIETHSFVSVFIMIYSCPMKSFIHADNFQYFIDNFLIYQFDIWVELYKSMYNTPFHTVLCLSVCVFDLIMYLLGWIGENYWLFFSTFKSCVYLWMKTCSERLSYVHSVIRGVN